ncbi:hypothetical protein [Streptomyces sp. WAC05374]|nr:hypothetical protein [Streptomyces sp. WAC05374]
MRALERTSGPGHPLYAHRACATEHRVRALYEVLPTPEPAP